MDPGVVGAAIVGSFCSAPELATTLIGRFGSFCLNISNAIYIALQASFSSSHEENVRVTQNITKTR